MERAEGAIRLTATGGTASPTPLMDRGVVTPTQERLQSKPRSGNTCVGGGVGRSGTSDLRRTEETKHGRSAGKIKNNMSVSAAEALTHYRISLRNKIK